MRIPLWKKTKGKKGKDKKGSVWKYVLPEQFRFYLIADEKPITIRIGTAEMIFEYDRDINLGRIQLIKVNRDYWKVIVDSTKPIHFKGEAIFIPFVIGNAKEIGIEAEDYHKPIAVIIGFIFALWKVIGWIKKK